ncbi:MAG: peptidoglycan editing factor PgeF [Granulosicoccus sp.]
MTGEPNEVSCSNEFASITVIVPQWAVSTRVTVLSTTRLGGVSQAPFDTLNLGLHVNDNHEHVHQNRARLIDSFALPEPPRWLNQTHSSDVIKLENEHGSTTNGCSADGVWTTRTDTVAAVLTADCLPVVLSDIDGAQIAVVHAGWRGLAGGILQNALSTFAHNTDVHAWLGPAIGPTAFEVGEDVRQRFVRHNAQLESEFVKTDNNGKYRANLYGLARAQLNSERSVTVTGGDYCTYSQANLFHSHRRDGVRSGRMATIAWISNA